MSRFRPRYDTSPAAPSLRGRGCLSIFLLPPILILAFGAGLIWLAPVPAALDPTLAPVAPAPLSPIFTPEVQYWSSSILRWSSQSGLDPNLLAVVMQIESCGNPYARSSAGALGLFQVMPYHFASTDDPFTPDTNALRGIDYLQRSLTAANSDVRLALAGYNGGVGLTSRSELLWPSESVRYAYWGSGIYQDAAGGAVRSSRLDDWLAAGGSSMCSRARQVLRL